MCIVLVHNKKTSLRAVGYFYQLLSGIVSVLYMASSLGANEKGSLNPVFWVLSAVD